MLSAFSVSAQPVAQYASGVSTLYSYFDPLKLNPVPRLPITVQPQRIIVPRPPVLPFAQYQQQKSTVPARIPIGPPQYISTSPVPPRLPLAKAPSLSFEGIQQTVFDPPSTNIAAGPEDVLQIVNSTIARYSKTGQQTNLTDLTEWFQDFLPVVCPSNFCTFGDVSIRYDQLHGHFIMTLQVLDQPSSKSYILISASSGATYSSGWKNWALNGSLDGTTLTTNWADFPQPGFDNDALYITCNMFSFSAFTFQYAKVRIIKKTDLYNPATGSLPYHDIFNMKNEDGTPASTLQAPQLRGRVNPGSPSFLVNASDSVNADYLTLWTVNNPVSNAPTLTRSTVHGLWPYKYPAAAPQLNSTVTLDTGPSSIAKAIVRNGRLYTAMNVGYADAPTTVTYDLVDLASGQLVSQARWSNGDFFYPALDVPATVGPNADFPNNLIVGTTTALPGGGLTFAGITGIKSGEDVYDKIASGNNARWGDYNGAGIDPVNGGMWISAEYAKTKNGTDARWGTWNAYIPWSSNQEFDDVPGSSPNFHFINVMKLWNITKGCSVTPSLFCPTDPATRATMAVFLIRALYGENFTFTQSPYFTDVPATDPSFPYVQKMKDLGITNGCSPTQFCPTMTTTREQAAVFITRAKMSNLFGDAFTYPTTAYFSDVPPTSPNFPFIQKFRELGVTTGCTATTFCPTMPITREQMAVFIVRALFN